MKTNQMICQVAWEPNPLTQLVQSLPVKEGKKLAASISEDVGSFSLSPAYSSKQLRTIKRLQMQKTRYNDDKPRKVNHGGRLRW